MAAGDGHSVSVQCQGSRNVGGPETRNVRLRPMGLKFSSCGVQGWEGGKVGRAETGRGEGSSA